MLKTPDITPAQITALGGAVVAVLVAFGAHLGAGERDALLQLVTVLAPVIVAADGLIRHGRAHLAAARPNAASTPQPPPGS